MTSATESVFKAVCASDPTVSKEMVKRAIALLNGNSAMALVRDSPIDRVISRKEVATILGVSTRTVTLYAKRGLLRPIKLSARGLKSNGYSESSVRALIEGRTTKAVGVSEVQEHTQKDNANGDSGKRDGFRRLFDAVREIAESCVWLDNKFCARDPKHAKIYRCIADFCDSVMNGFDGGQ